MPGGKIKFGFDIGVTGETEIGLFSPQKVLGDLGSMNLMTVITPYRTQLMDSSPELEKFLLLLVTIQAGIRLLDRSLVFEREDDPHSFALLLCLGMFSSRTMAGFASFIPVGIFLKDVVHIWMAFLTRFRSYISFLFRLLLLAKRRETNEGYQSR